MKKKEQIASVQANLNELISKKETNEHYISVLELKNRHFEKCIEAVQDYLIFLKEGYVDSSYKAFEMDAALDLSASEKAAQYILSEMTDIPPGQLGRINEVRRRSIFEDIRENVMEVFKRDQRFLNKKELEDKLSGVPLLKLDHFSRYLTRMREVKDLCAIQINDSRKHVYYGLYDWSGDDEKVEALKYEYYERGIWPIKIMMLA